MTNPIERAKSIFLAAIEEHSPEQWPAYLDGACGTDAALRQRVEELLAAHVAMGSIHAAPQASTAAQGPLEQPGEQIGPYKLLQLIGEGGMGAVYMAEQKTPVERRVALKIIKPGMDSRQIIARFEAERQALAMMDHPHIAKVFDAGTTDSGRPYFVMELVKGQPITSYCDEHRLSLRERLELLIPVCHALQHAHQKGIIHRDIKPSNVLIAEYDHQAVPKVIDFGVAKALHQPLTEKTMFTQFGQLVGTLEYMSPEQAKVNQLDIDTRSDVYSLGVLLYEMLTAVTPFDKERLRCAGWDEILRIIREEDPPKPSLRLSSSQTLPSVAAGRGVEPRRLPAIVQGELDWIVMKALEKDRNRRYGSANDLALDLRRYLNSEPVLAGPPSTAYKAAKFIRKHRGPVAAALTVALAVIVGFVVSTILLFQVNQQRRLAVQSRHELIEKGRELEQALHNVIDERDQKDQALIAKTEALQAKDEALQERSLALRRANALRLTALSSAELPHNPGRSLLLAIEAARREPDLAPVNNSLLAALATCRERSAWDLGAAASGVAISPNGQRVAIVLTNKSFVIRDTDSGRVVATLAAANTLPEITRLVFSPDNRHLLTLFQGYNAQKLSDDRIRLFTDNVARIWDLETARELLVLRGHHDRISDAVYSPDGTRIATASWDGQARVWDARTGECLSVSEIPAQARGPGEVAQTTTSSRDKTIAALAQGPPSLNGVRWNHDASRLLLWSDRMRQHSLTTLEGQPAPDIVNPDFDVSETTIGSLGSGVGASFSSLDDESTIGAVLCDAATGSFVRRLALGPNANPQGAHFSLDGRFALFALGTEGRLVLCDVETGQTMAESSGIWGKPFYRNAEALRAVIDVESPQRASLRQLAVGRTFSPQSDKFLEVHEDRVLVHDAESWQPLAELRGHDEQVRDACFSSDGRSVLSVSTDGTLRLWNLDAQPAYRLLSGHSETVLRARFSPSGAEVVTAGGDGKAVVWDVHTGVARLELTRRFDPPWHQAHEALSGQWTDARYSSDGTRIITAADEPLATWQLAKDQEVKTMPFHPTRIWDARTGEEFMQLPGATLALPPMANERSADPVPRATRGYSDVAVAITPTGEFSVTVDGPNCRHVRLEGSDADVTSSGHTGNITYSDAEGRPLGPFHAVHVWKLETRQLLHRLACDTQGVVPRISANGLVAVTAGQSEAIVWDTVTARERCRLPLELGNFQDYDDVCLSPGGKWLVTPAIAGKATVWNLHSGQEVRQLKEVYKGLAFSPDDSLLVTSGGTAAQVWDTRDWRRLSTLDGHRYQITGANFSPDGQWIVTFGLDPTARVWQAATGVERVTLAGHTAEIRWAEFSPDGSQIVTASRDRTARLWPLDLLQLAQQRRPRELTAEERRRFEVLEE